MKTLAIHDIKPEFRTFPFSNYYLTFDDGLFSQYFYWDFFEKESFNILFISTNLIEVEYKKRRQWNGSDNLSIFPTCFEALADYRKTGNRENYMRLDELKELMDNGVTIGAHGHDHTPSMSKLNEDTEKMLEWFQKHLKITPTKFAFPHYEESDVRKVILMQYGFREFYGNWRIEIEKEKDLLSNV